MATDDPTEPVPDRLPRLVDLPPDRASSLLTVRQRFIADRLHEQSPTLADWYISAVATMATRSIPAWIPVVGHLCRDLMNGAPRHFDLPTGARVDYADLVETISGALPDRYDALPAELPALARDALTDLIRQHRNLSDRLSPEALFAVAGRPQSGSETARKTLVREWRDTQRFFLAITHLGARDAAPVAAAQVDRHFAALEDMLGAQLRAVPYWSLDGELREIAALSVPTAEDLQRAMRLWRGDAETTFIESLQNPEWVRLFVDAGFLDAPQRAERVGEGVRLPFWAISHYLARVASRAPSAVLAAIDRLGPTDNGRVHADLVEAVLAMPAVDGVKACAPIITWLAGPWPGFVAESAARLAVALAAAGESDAALRLARKLVSFDVRVQERDPPSEYFGPRIFYVTVFHGDDDYADALRELVPGLVAGDPIGMVRLLAKVVGGVLWRERHLRHEDGPEDDSWIWRKGIADASRGRSRDDPRDVLVSALRDAAVAAVVEPAHVADVMVILDGQPHLLFRRLTMHLARIGDADELRARGRALLVDRERFDGVEYRNDYFLLLRDRFGELAPSDQETILGWIDDGPDLDAWRSHAPDSATAEDAADYADWWRYTRLTLIDNDLTGDAATGLAAFRESLGPIADPTINADMQVAWGGVGPRYDIADLRALSAAELVETIVSYQPNRDAFPPEPDGALIEVLSGAVAQDTGHWLPFLLPLADALPAEYEAGVLNGTWSAARDGAVGDWNSAITLTEHALGRADLDDDHEHRRLLVDAVVRVVEAAVRDTDNAPAVDLTLRLLGLIDRLMSNDEPTAATDAKRRDEPAFGAFSSTRARTLDAAVVLAMRLHPDARAITTPVLQHLPAIRAVLERHLDPDIEPSPLVRFVYGARFGALLFIDESWTAARVSEIFDSGRPALEAAAWRGFLLRSHRAPVVAERIIAAGLYGKHLEILRDPPPVDRDRAGGREERDTREALIEHFAYIWTFAVPGFAALTDQLLAIATPADRAEFVETLAFRVLQAEGTEAIVADTAHRLLAFWRERLAQLEPRDPELSSFGWWYSAGALAEPEATDLMAATIRAADGAIDDLRGCLEQAAAIAGSNATGASDVLDALLEAGARDELATSGPRVRRLIEAIVSSDDPDARGRADNLIDRLGEYGLGDYRDVRTDASNREDDNPGP